MKSMNRKQLYKASMFMFERKITFCIGYYEVFGVFVWPHLANLLLNELKKLHFWIPLNARLTVLAQIRVTDSSILLEYLPFRETF